MQWQPVVGSVIKGGELKREGSDMLKQFTKLAAAIVLALASTAAHPEDGLKSVLMDTNGGCMSGPMEQFGRYIGDWDIADEALSRADGKTWTPGNGARWNFTCVGNGIAVQDFWMPKGPKNAAEDGPPPGVGTNLRIYDAASETWKIVWTATNSPGFGQISAKQDASGNIVMHWVDPEQNPPRRITFFPPTAAGWNWVMEMSTDEGKSWFPAYRIRATRRE